MKVIWTRNPYLGYSLHVLFFLCGGKKYDGCFFFFLSLNSSLGEDDVDSIFWVVFFSFLCFLLREKREETAGSAYKRWSHLSTLENRTRNIAVVYLGSH